MNHNTNVIEKNDFEKYEVLLPFYAAIGKRRKNYLCTELEKMHPCFSDEYSFDSAIHGVCEKGLKTDVLVMSKYKLAEYEGRRRFSGTGFFVENESRRFRFPFFMSNTWKGTLAGIVLCFVLGGAGVICGVKGRVVLDKKISSDEGIGIDQKIAIEAGDKNPADLIEAGKKLSEDFFEAVKNAKGVIDFFEWENDGFNEKIIASVYGVFPENLSDLKQNNVTYENGLPHINVSFTERLASGDMHGGRGDFSVSVSDKFSGLPQKIRTAILHSGGGLCEENGLSEDKSNPYHVDFQCQTGSQVQNCLREINGLAGEAGVAVCGVSVRRDGKNGFKIGVSIASVFSDGFDLSLIYENIFLFRNMMENQNTATVKNVVAIHKTSDKGKISNKIGEIRRADNSLVIYYKNENGKLEQIIQKPEVGE